jgi:hypothetical protein
MRTRKGLLSVGLFVLGIASASVGANATASHGESSTTTDSKPWCPAPTARATPQPRAPAASWDPQTCAAVQCVCSPYCCGNGADPNCVAKLIMCQTFGWSPC